MEERRFGEFHLTRHVLHPALVPRAGEDAHGGGVAAERATRECVHLHDPQTHVPKLACFPRGARARSSVIPVTTLGHRSDGQEGSICTGTKRRSYPFGALGESPMGLEVHDRCLHESRSIRGAVDCVQTTAPRMDRDSWRRSEEHTSELQSPDQLVCRLLLEKKKQKS